MFHRFMPWKSIVRRAARAYGVTDPVRWLNRLRGFSQPSEVAEPIELLRAGIHFHARGLVNTKAIQHNLDWVWPYWVERQFDPSDPSFIPRAFSFSHINLTHRNWTAIGWPELPAYPIVDPRGLVTPLYDGWSIDVWLIDANGKQLLPSRAKDADVRQSLTTSGDMVVETQVHATDIKLTLRTMVILQNDVPTVQTSVVAASLGGGSLAVAVRPYNPEGVQFIDRVESLPHQKGWLVNGDTMVLTDKPADRMLTSHYDEGDVLHSIAELAESNAVRGLDTRAEPHNKAGAGADRISETCDQGMATAVSVFPFTSNEFSLSVTVPLSPAASTPTMTSATRHDGQHAEHADTHRSFGDVAWDSVTTDISELKISDSRITSLYQTAVRTLILLSVEDVVPGPYTYRRFWFRDACLMMHPMMSVGLLHRCRRMLNQFPSRQLKNGYFRSQDGEWDSNGQVLWILNRFRRLSGEQLPDHLVAPLESAVRWIDRKRVTNEPGARHAGLLPAGFSAEHLGPNDFYYWDDLWAQAGLQAAGEIWEERGQTQLSNWAGRLAEEMRLAIEKSLTGLPKNKIQGGFPASPYRRLDSGAIGSMVADYPLQLTAPRDARIMATIEVLLADHFCHGGFFQDMVHSGINAYLTLAVAQTLLRNADSRYQTLIRSVANLASPTGQWPEAIHPGTLGGCMGDGQHGWAAAEWVMMIRNCFVREERDRLIVGSGIFESWLSTDDEVKFGPTHTPWGRITVRLQQAQSQPVIEILAQWHSEPVRMDVQIPGFRQIENIQPNVEIPLQRDVSGPADPATFQVIPAQGSRS